VGAISMKYKIIVVVLLSLIIFSACAKAQPPEVLPTVFNTYTPYFSTSLPTLEIVNFNATTLPGFNTISPPATLTPSPRATVTLTLDYGALGLASPTFTPTFDYDDLAEYYLTPFTPWPTPTGIPSSTPTANIPNMLSSVVIQKVSPQFPPIKEINYEGRPQDANEWIPAYIQTVTDLMNYVDGDQELYLQYVKSWVPTALDYSPNDWFLEDDFDNNGQIEWLVSIPIRFPADGVDRCGFRISHYGYCPRLFLIFEKRGDAYYPKHIFEPGELNFNESRVALVKDLNTDNTKEIVFRADPCGAAVCSTSLRIGNWNGQQWEWLGYIANDHADVKFTDIDENGTVEIMVAYPTYAASRYNSPYSRRDVVDIYGWKNDRFEIVDQIYPPTDSIFEIIFDIASVLEYKNAELALKYASPVIDNLNESCDRMKTYVGIQTMLAYAIQGESNNMKSVLTILEKHCDFPGNAYVPAAKILWLSYEKSHDAISACQGMERFLMSEYSRENGRWKEALFIEDYPAYRPSCPRK
jgi:hypothetical protein